MPFFRLADIIGQEITDVRKEYIPPGDGEYSVPMLNTYIKLANNSIIGIPNSNDGYFRWLSLEDQSGFQKFFDNLDLISGEDREIVTGQKIVDMLFCYDNNEPAYEYSAYLKLSNGYYLTERSYEMVAFRLLSEQRFLEEKVELAKRLNIEIRSFLKEQQP